jgi:SOS-response transcriptional repressor LexA
MHKIQVELLSLAKQSDLGKMSLRQIAKIVGVEGKPQIIKHHLQQLEKAGLIQLSLESNVVRPTNRGFNHGPSKSPLYSLPLVGAANCGPATIFAEDQIEGYLKVSSKMLPRRKQDLYVLRAEGQSMNKAEVNGKTIEDGDFVVVDRSHRSPANGDIVVAVIDGMGTIKRYKEDKKNERIVLEPDSTEDYLPIFMHEGDNCVIAGKVVDIIKK